MQHFASLVFAVSLAVSCLQKAVAVPAVINCVACQSDEIHGVTVPADSSILGLNSSSACVACHSDHVNLPGVLVAKPLASAYGSCKSDRMDAATVSVASALTPLSPSVKHHPESTVLPTPDTKAFNSDCVGCHSEDVIQATSVCKSHLHPTKTACAGCVGGAAIETFSLTQPIDLD